MSDLSEFDCCVRKISQVLINADLSQEDLKLALKRAEENYFAEVIREKVKQVNEVLKDLYDLEKVQVVTLALGARMDSFQGSLSYTDCIFNFNISRHGLENNE